MQNPKKSIWQKGKIVGYPTESFYALGVPATDAAAIRGLFRVKHREKNKPVALIAADVAQVKQFFFMSKTETRMAKKNWPGSLTILLKPKAPSTPNLSSGRRGWIAADVLFPTTPASHSTGHPSLKRRGLVRIGVRVPAHVGARELARQTGSPITATSANLSGQPPTKSVIRVKRQFPGILVAPGRCGRQRRPSTIIKIDNGKITVIRQAAVQV